MKRLFSFMMALVLVLSLGVTAFATENEPAPTTETGSITVTNATKDKVYSVYKIFNASISEDGKSVSYTLDPANTTINNLLFNAKGEPTADNKFFVLNKNTNGVSKAEGVNDSELTAYLQKLINENTSLTPVKSETATDKTVVFSDLPYGYYVVKSTLGATVTINSTTTNVQVIDKNQTPGGGFDKSVKNGDTYSDANTAGIGDVVYYKIEFEATNYDGDKQIKYYQINDQKGDALWAEFLSFEVWVGDKKLNKGYYLCLGNEQELNTNNWKYLGTWTDEEIASNATPDWYLVHLGYDQFRITIPWLTGHYLESGTNAETGYKTYTIKYGETPTPLFTSPSKVVVTYKAAVEAGAQVGGNGHNLYNEASATWTSEFESESTSTDRTETYVYGIGILKDDLADGRNLPGAEFRIYSDEDCTKPVYVIPTNIQGVYVVDSKGKEVLTGSKMQTSRDLYKAYLAGYLGSDYETTGKQDNLLVTPVNGKVAVLGLAEGTYYVLETKAPEGYNAVSTAIVFETSTANARTFSVFADSNGNVADIQAASGNYVEHSYMLSHTIVHNSTGVELPSTGGEGTMMMITIGTMIAMAFAVLLITHKKMSIYHD